jgi:thioesterase domain-containing protein/acyl carrier protein
VFQVDIADWDSLSAAWAAIRESMPPPDGVFHLAGALDDGVLAGQDWGRFERVLGPKVAGAWNLHLLSEGLPLSWFVLFSSVAGLWGSAGQGNYAAANAFLDVLAYYRRARGLPAVSIDWGAWAEVGMAADLGAAVERRRSAAGMGKIDPARGMELLGQLLGEDQAQAAVIPVDWPQYLKTAAELDRATFFSALRADANTQTVTAASAPPLRSGILQTLASIEPARRGAALVEFLAGQISRIGGIPAGSLDTGRSLAELGIDSLMAVELRNRITADLDLQVPMSLFLGNPDIRHLGLFLLEQLDRSPEADSRTGSRNRRTNGSHEKPAPAVQPADPLLVPLQRDGTGRPFFCVHGFGGGVLGYGDLARLVGAQRPFIGIRALGMDGEAEPDETVEAMASRYVEAIRRVQPAGPYDLGGYCLGGVVAFEMARQLRAAGDAVGLVAVIEGHAPGGVRERARFSSRLPAIWRNMPYWFQDYWKLGFSGIRRRIRLKTARWRPRRGEPGMALIAPQDLVDDDISSLPEHHLRIMTLQIRAHRSYITRPFRGKVTVFKAKDQSIGKTLFGTLDPSLGWGQYADEVEVVEVEGGHRDLHLKPHVQSLAGSLKRALEPE